MARARSSQARRPSQAVGKRARFEIEAEKGSEVFVAGSFNGWDPAKNKLTFRRGVYSTSILLPAGRHEYKFVVNGIWCVDPECAEWTPNGMGALNSVLVVD